MALASLGFIAWLALDWYKELQRAQMLKARATRLQDHRVRILHLPHY